MTRRLSTGKNNFLTEKELRMMREAVESVALDELCDIYSRVEQMSAVGSVVQALTKSYRNVPCSVSAVSSREGERLIGEAIKDRLLLMFSLPYDQPILPESVIGYNNLLWDVIHILDFGNECISKRVVCARTTHWNNTGEPPIEGADYWLLGNTVVQPETPPTPE
jgi:hypothetical protein